VGSFDGNPWGLSLAVDMRLGIRTPPGGEAMLEALQAAFAGNTAKLRAKIETVP
jgi:hypothetical protein